MKCSKCNAAIDDAEARFCPSCGASLDAPAPPQPSPRKSKKTMRIVLGAFVCLLLVTGFLFRESLARILPFLHPSSSARAAELAPGDTGLFLVINPGLDQVKNFTRLRDIYLSIPEVKKAFDNLQRGFTEEFGLDFKEDVKPWLGREIALIVPDFNDEKKYLLAVSTTNKKKTAACLQKLRQHLESEGSTFAERVYEGVKITVETGGSCKVAYALHEGFLLLAESEDAIARAIDMTRQKGAATLAKNETYKRVMEKLPKDRSGACYVDAENMRKFIAEEIGTDLLAASLNQLEAYQGLGFSISFTGEGARFDNVMACNKTKMPKDLPPPGKGEGIEKTVRLAPESSLAFVGAANVNYALEKTLEEMQKFPYFRDIEKEIEYYVGIDLKRDFLSWLGGEIGLAVVPDRDGLLGKEINVGMLAMFSVKDVQRAKSLLDKIADWLDEEGVTSDSVKVDGKNVECFYEPYTKKFMLGYGFTDNFLVIGSSEKLVQEALTGGGRSLAESDTYKKAFAGLLPHGEGCIFVDVKRSVDAVHANLSRYEREYFDREVYPYLKPVRAVSLRQTRTDDNFLVGTLAVSVE